jgi:hypothetical protein
MTTQMRPGPKMGLHEYITINTEKVPLGTGEFDVDMVFFGVNVNVNANMDDLLPLLPYHGKFGVPNLNILSGDVYNYIEVGAWLDDQELALRLMALGAQLELWRVISPLEVNNEMPIAVSIAMAKTGMLAIVSTHTE